MLLTEKHMDLLTRDSLHPILQDQPTLCASLYLPTHRRGKETQQDPVMLKNALREIERELVEKGLRLTEATEITASAWPLIEDTVYWSHQLDGLAMFLGRNDAYAFRLPLQFSEQVICENQFYIRPLLPMLTGDGRFYILRISQNNIRLLQCSRYTVSEVELRDVKNVKEMLAQFDVDQSLSMRHASASGVQGRGAGGTHFHNHGEGGDDMDIKSRALEFFQHVDGKVREALDGETAPMILAGVEYMRAHYRLASKYPFIANEGIDGNQDAVSDEDLARKGWELVAPQFQQERQAELERLRHFLGTGDRKGSDALHSIITAAWSRMVETLFIPAQEQLWGLFDPEAMDVQVHRERLPRDEEMLNLACIYTLRSGGTIYECAPEELPDGAMAAAIFR